MDRSTKYKLKKGIIKTYWHPELKNKCKICQQEFTPPRNRPYQEYCGKPECLKERNRQKSKRYEEKHREERNEKAVMDRQLNPEKHKLINKKYYDSEKGKENVKRKYLTSGKRIATRWAQDNPEKIKEIQAKQRASPKRIEYIKNYYSIARHKIRMRISNLIYQSIKGKKLGKHWEGLVGYTLEELMKHLESKFQEGMSWENYGKWHIDHFIPESWFHFETVYDEEFKKCWALSNLQPKWARENLQKNNHYVG